MQHSIILFVTTVISMTTLSDYHSETFWGLGVLGIVNSQKLVLFSNLYSCCYSDESIFGGWESVDSVFCIFCVVVVFFKRVNGKLGVPCSFGNKSCSLTLE